MRFLVEVCNYLEFFVAVFRDIIISGAEAVDFFKELLVFGFEVGFIGKFNGGFNYFEDIRFIRVSFTVGFFSFFL